MPVDREVCDVCDFEWAIVRPEEVRARINAAIGDVATVLLADPTNSLVRPSPSRWSTVEYGAHVRDVLLNVRDRLVLIVVEDQPTPGPLYRDERVDLGLYSHETARSVAESLEVAAKLFTATFDALRLEYLERTIVYGYPVAAIRTLGWTGAQVVHECEHHLRDVRENAVQLGRR